MVLVFELQGRIFLQSAHKLLAYIALVISQRLRVRSQEVRMLTDD
jgi:hypothetical protein